MYQGVSVVYSPWLASPMAGVRSSGIRAAAETAAATRRVRHQGARILGCHGRKVQMPKIMGEPDFFSHSLFAFVKEIFGGESG